MNNIYLSEAEIMSVKICPEIVNHSFISEINNPGKNSSEATALIFLDSFLRIYLLSIIDDIHRGVVYACSYQDASEVIPELPVLQVSGILD